MSVFTGPYAFVEGLDPEVDIFPWTDPAELPDPDLHQTGLTIVEAPCGHYRVTTGDGYADDTHYTTMSAAIDALAVAA